MRGGLVRVSSALLAFACAFLTISVQPAIVGQLMPRVGGDPFLWHWVQCTFQALLLCGYLLGAAANSRNRRVFSLWPIVSVAAAISLAIPSPVASPGSGIGSALAFLVRTYGFPFVALCSASVGLQGAVGRQTSRSAYWLYAASCLGSTAAAIAYVFAIEPYVDLSSQLRLWKLIGAVALMGTALVALTSWTATDRDAAKNATRTAIPLQKALLWIGCGLGPVLLSLTCTTFLISEFGANPLTWMGPFAFFLLTSALAFVDFGVPIVRGLAKAAPAAVALVLCTTLLPPSNPTVALSIHLASAASLLAAWQTLAISVRPISTDGSRFFVLVAVGGLMGGIAAAFVAPSFLTPTILNLHHTAVGRLLLDRPSPEYIVAVLLTILVLNVGRLRLPWNTGLLRSFCAVAVGLTLPLAIRIGEVRGGSAIITAAILVGAVAIYTPRRRDILFCSLAVIGVVVVRYDSPKNAVFTGRSPFHYLHVADTDGRRILTNGTIVHGSQALNCIIGDVACDDPASYYSRSGPLGLAFDHLRERLPRIRTLAIGLGVGSLAAYCQPGDSLSFLEVDPMVERVANDFFRFLDYGRTRCSTMAVKIGDGRLLTSNETQDFDLIVGDAFSGDAIPIHLLTRDALREAVHRLRPGGLIAMHVSNRYYRLAPVVVTNAHSLDLSSITVVDRGGPGRMSSTWVFVATSGEQVSGLEHSVRQTSGLAVQTVGSSVQWTDERHSTVTVLR